jgi:hypothetical protein
MKRGSSSQAIVGREAQVDLCLADGGMVVSIGPVSLWLTRADAEDLVETLEMALLVSRREAEPRDAATEVARRAATAS